MTDQILVVSNPPHNEVDRRQAARCFGLTPAEARMKANFRAPEIWLADSDRAAVEDGATRLREAGLNVGVFLGSDLLSLPPQLAVKSFAFTDTSLTVDVGESVEMEEPFDAAIKGVFCKPPGDYSSRTGQAGSLADTLGRRSTSVLLDGLGGSAAVHSHLDLAEVLERASFLDLYVEHERDLRRISVAQDLADFSGLGDAKQLTAAANMVTFVTECECRFSDLHVDKRLVDVHPRRRPTVGSVEPHREDRKLYSFGTRSLSKLLHSISPGLRNVTQSELGSRLAYVLNAQN